MIDINTKVVKLDINKNIYENIVAKQGDTKSRFLLFNLLDGASPFDLTNKKSRCYLIKPDGKKVFNDLVITDSKRGYCILELTNQILAVAGNANLEIMITENEKKLTSIPFKLQIIKSINDETAIVSTNEFSSLMNGLSKIEAWDKEFEDKSGKLEELYTPRLNELGSQMEDMETNKANYVETKNDINKALTYLESVGYECKASLSSEKTLTKDDNNWQIVPLDKIEQKGSLFELTNNNIIFKKAGVFLIQVISIFRNTTTPCYRAIRLDRNGVQELAYDTGITNTTYWLTLKCNTTVTVGINDWLTLKAHIKTLDTILPNRDFGNYIKITCIKDLTPPTVVTAPPTTRNTLYHILGTGQSLSVGAEGTPLLTTTPLETVGQCYMFNGGVRPNDLNAENVAENTIVTSDSWLSSLAPCKEQEHNYTLNQAGKSAGETISSSMLYGVANKKNVRLLVSQHGVGGQNYQQLKKGTIPYNNAIKAIQKGKQLAENRGWDYKVLAVTTVHGEADSVAGTTYANYKQYLKDWINDFNADIKNITGQTETVKLLVSQTASASAYNLEGSPICNAQLFASWEDDRIIHVTPQYQFTYAQDNVSPHMDGYGYRYLGEYYGKVITELLEGRTWTGIRPKKSTLSGNTITIDFDVPTPPLVLDGLNVKQVEDGNYGFRLFNVENGATITKVEVVNSTSIKLTCSVAPTGQYLMVGYAYKPFESEKGYMGKEKGLRGCIRDSNGYTSIFDKKSLPNWCSIFSINANWSR